MTLRALKVICCAVPFTLAAEAPFDRDGAGVSGALNALATGNYRLAEELSGRALQRSDERRGPNHPSTALARRNHAITLWQLGRFDEARDELKAASRDLKGDKALRVTLDLASLAADKGDYNESTRLWEKALKGATGGPFRMEAAEGLALARFALGDFNGGRDALGALKGSTAPDTAYRCGLIEADAELASKNYKAAWPLYGRALEVGAALHGKEHPFLAPAFEGMGRALLGMGKKDEGRSTLYQALEGRQRMAGMLNHDSMAQHEALARLYADLGQPRDAKEIYGKIVQLRKEIQPGHPAIARLQKIFNSIKP